jgi:hypothetical protein
VGDSNHDLLADGVVAPGASNTMAAVPSKILGFLITVALDCLLFDLAGKLVLLGPS